MPSPTDTAVRPLDGVRVLELGQFIAGPFAGVRTCTEGFAESLATRGKLRLVIGQAQAQQVGVGDAEGQGFELGYFLLHCLLVCRQSLRGLLVLEFEQAEAAGTVGMHIMQRLVLLEQGQQCLAGAIVAPAAVMLQDMHEAVAGLFVTRLQYTGTAVPVARL